MRPVIPHKVARPGLANGKWLAGLIGFILIVALGVWVWGLLNLPRLPAILLWWWPSLLAGALAGAAAGVALEAARSLQRIFQKRKTRTQRHAPLEPAGQTEAVSTPLSPAE